MSFSQRQQLTQPFKIATMRQQGYLLELAPSFQSWFICFFDDRWRQSGLNQTTIERNARDFDWSLDLLRRGHSPANQWAALGPFQGLRKLYHYYRGTSVGMQYIDDEQIYKHLAAALARGQMEVHKVYDPHEAYRAFAAAAASSGASSSAASDESGNESKPETRRVEAGGASTSVDAPSECPPETDLPPQSLDDCRERLHLASAKLKQHGYIAKYSDDELRAMARSGAAPKDRFLVRFSEAPTSTDAPIGHLRDSGRHPLWLSTFDMIERADTDPRIIADVFGTHYDPNKKYVMYILDRGENYEIDGSDLFVPTYENMRKKLKDEFAGEISPELIDSVMSPEYSSEFRGHWKEFNSYLSKLGIPWQKSFDTDYAAKYAAENISSPTDQAKFMARQSILAEIGAWEVFTGDGLTERKSEKGKPGSLEVFEIQHRPESVSYMIDSGKAIRLEL